RARSASGGRKQLVRAQHATSHATPAGTHFITPGGPLRMTRFFPTGADDGDAATAPTLPDSGGQGKMCDTFAAVEATVTTVMLRRVVVPGLGALASIALFAGVGGGCGSSGSGGSTGAGGTG